MPDLQWLTARPIAHRGLHDADRGIIENTPSAVAAALDHGYAIEVDLQLTQDGEAVVFHDQTLDRLTEESGPVVGHTVAQLRAVRYRATSDRIQTLPELLEQVAGQNTLVLELKSPWFGGDRLERRVAQVLSSYSGPVAVMSFDPHSIATLRQIAPDLIRGIVSCSYADPKEWPELSRWERLRLRFLLHFPQTRPHFVSYDVHDLPALGPWVARALGRPVIVWTVRSQAEADHAGKWADQITFEQSVPRDGQ